jgi:dienelactone hydrolase
MVIANGPITQPFGTTEGRDGKSMMAAKHPSTLAYQLTESVNWAFAGAAGGKYGTPDISKIAVAGQSCGGVQAYSAAYKDTRIKHIGIFNSGVFAGGQRSLLAQIKQPVVLFHGGPLDMASQSVSDDLYFAPSRLRRLFRVFSHDSHPKLRLQRNQHDVGRK